MSRTERHLDPLAIARHLGGDGGWWAHRRWDRHLAACPACRARLGRIEAERAEYDADPMRRLEADALIRAASGPPAHRVSDARQRDRTRGWVIAVSAMAVAGALLLFLASERPPTPVIGDAPGVVLRAKGADVFAVYLARDDAIGPLPPECHPGDRVRARLEGSGRWVLLLGIDPSGQASPLMHDGAGRSIQLEDTPRWSPGSWILDGTPGTERFVAVFSDATLTLPAALRAIRKQSADPLEPLPGVTIIEQLCTKAGR